MGLYANKPDTINLILPGHVHIGHSMRIGNLQTPVEYDHWSYGLQDIQGSKIHNSKCEDQWGGEVFCPGDVVCFAICLTGKDNGNSAGVTGSSGDGTATTEGTYKGSTSGIDGLMGLDGNDTELSTTHHRTNVPTPFTTAAVTTISNEKNLPTSTNHIYFFKNGEPMGHFIVSR
eukprot:10605681-Ditylum_brightwellii.AAC.1